MVRFSVWLEVEVGCGKLRMSKYYSFLERSDGFTKAIQLFNFNSLLISSQVCLLRISFLCCGLFELCHWSYRFQIPFFTLLDNQIYLLFIWVTFPSYTKNSIGIQIISLQNASHTFLVQNLNWITRFTYWRGFAMTDRPEVPNYCWELPDKSAVGGGRRSISESASALEGSSTEPRNTSPPETPVRKLTRRKTPSIIGNSPSPLHVAALFASAARAAIGTNCNHLCMFKIFI